MNLIFFCFCTTLQVFSQQHDPNYLDLKYLVSEYSNTNQILFFCRSDNEHQGSTGTAMNWKKSVLLTTTNDTIAVSAFLDLSKDEILLQIDQTTYYLFQEKVQAIAIEDQVYIVAKYPSNDQLFLGYFELINQGKISLLLKEKDVFYSKKEGDSAQKIKRSKKGIYKALGKSYPNVDKLIANKQLNVKNDKDLKQLFYLINKALKAQEQQ